MVEIGIKVDNAVTLHFEISDNFEKHVGDNPRFYPTEVEDVINTVKQRIMPMIEARFRP